MPKQQSLIALLAALIISAPVQSWAAGVCFCDGHDGSVTTEHVAGHGAPMADTTMSGDGMQHATMDHESNECGESGAACECNACGAFSGLNSSDRLARIFAVQSQEDIVDLYIAPPDIPTHPPPISS